MALRENGVPAELHIYEKGRHGLGLGEKDPNLAFALRTWPDLLHNWLKLRALLGNSGK